MITRLAYDKSRCSGSSCMLRYTCLRFTCEESLFPTSQTDFSFKTPVENECSFHIPNRYEEKV